VAKDHLLDYVPGFPSTSHNRRVSGPCPWCGGEDRFVVFVDDGEHSRGGYHCFNNPGNGCGETGDAIEFLREYHDMSFPEAVKALGLEEEKLNGKSVEQKRIEQEKQAPDAALRVKQWNIVRQRIAAIKDERKRRKAKLRRKQKREHRRKIKENMNAQERWLLSEVKVYQRTRKMHRAIARFVTLHAQPKCEGIGNCLVPRETPMEVLAQPSRFDHVEDLYRAFRKGLAEGLDKAPSLDKEETENRHKKLFELVEEAQKQRGQL